MPRDEVAWKEKFRRLQAFVKVHGHMAVTVSTTLKNKKGMY
jgi:hypothetical protein